MTERHEEFASRRARVKHSSREMAKLASARSHSARRPRSAEEAAVIRRMALGAIRTRERLGMLERVGPREYVLHNRADEGGKL